MKLTGQRWRFELGNALVCVDNAFNLLTLWSQERLVVNEEVVAQGHGYFRARGVFSTPWLTRLGETELQVLAIGRARGVEVDVRLDGERQLPTEHYNAVWRGAAREWPPEDAWQPGTNWINVPRSYE